ncbi:MAG TPA: 2-succinyl-5-enolpyruvyl-6-hydroxy-3-cyclohexene-1-carboxylic-acid synthase, partial [Acidimicrobiales bacterium]|nr:2-succinyl-5-enolpyruvyl-6-hydroxy-3-cyclohexene-1-carboxylic-acid synthase [Acidimicrobiales bacterium]
KALNAGQALATVLVDELVRNGLAHACIAPGSRSTPMALAFVGHPGVAVHVLIDERSAAFCALGIARASGSPAAVLCTSGTAAANFHPAVIEADRGRVPLLVLTADRPPELRGTGANQAIDQIKLYGDAVRWFAEVGAPEVLPGSVAYWRSAACRAWAATVGSPPGPVHLNLAFRDPLVPVADDAGFPHPLDGRPGQEPWTRTGASPAGMSAEDRRGLRALLAAADRCLVVAGEAPGGAGGAQAALAASGGWPLLADPLSGARLGVTAVSAYEAILRHPGFVGAMRPDLVVRVGRMGTSKPLAGYLGPDVPQVVVDPDGDWTDPGRSARWIIRADPRELPSLVEPSGPHPWTQRWLEAEAAARSAIDAVLDVGDSPSEPRTARDLAAWCPDGATLVAASSMPIRDLESFMRPRSGLRVIANRGASGIDGFVSTTLGAALAGHGPTVALAGDLSMLHDQNGLLLARSGSVDAVFVVVNNDGGGIFSFLPQAEFPGDFERLFGTPHGMPFEAVAALYRCGYRRVEPAAGLTAAVGEALSAGGVHLVEVPTERAANVELHRRIWRAVGTALDAGGFGG